MQTIKDLLIEALDNSVTFAEKMEKHTTIKIGGAAQYFVTANNQNAIIKTMELAKENDLDVFAIGNGSNLLVSDQGIDGIVLKIYSSELTPLVNGNRVTVFSGFPLGKLINLTNQKGLAGLEGLVGIPGSVGGAISMNAGTEIVEIGQLVNWVKVLDKNTLKVKTLPKRDLGFAYRSSIFQSHKYVILEAEIELAPEDPEVLKTLKSQIIKNRNSKQPVHFPNSGSIFKNPPNNSAGRLIDEIGLKGYTIGDAQISEQHGNFIVNRDKAKAYEVLQLMNLARKKVYNEFNIVLEPEVKFMGGGLKLEEV